MLSFRCVGVEWWCSEVKRLEEVYFGGFTQVDGRDKGVDQTDQVRFQ